MPPIRLALIGTGIFAREAHLPSIQALGDTFEIVAVCSRRTESATAFAARLPHPVAVCDDVPTLLARDDIEAVDILLPIDTMPGVVEQVLSAGKHIISEKPIAPDVATGRKLLAHHAQHTGSVWMVAENWRYEPAFVHAAEIVARGEIGRPLTCTWNIHTSFPPDNRYYQTAWRRAATYQGGVLLDGGVHHIAALRLVLGEIAEVSAVVTQFRPDLPPADTISTVLTFENGVIGSYSLTFAGNAPWPPDMHIMGDRGALAVQPGAVDVITPDHTQRIEVPTHQGVQNELAAFAAAIRDGTPHHNTPAQALQDVAVIEALLRAAETGRRVAPERVV